MKKQKKGDYEKHIFLIVFIIIIALAFLVIKPFITAILSAFVIAYIMHPLFRLLNRKIKNKNIASFLVCFLMIFIILFPLVFLFNVLGSELYSAYIFIKAKIPETNVFSFECVDNNIFCQLSYYYQTFGSYMGEFAKNAASSLLRNASSFLLRVPAKVIGFFVTVVLTFFFIRDGEGLNKRLWSLVPLKKEHQKKIMERVNNTIHAVVFGQIVVALVQGIVAYIGFLIFGVPSPLLWGVVTFLIGLIPFIGAPFVWVPAFLYLLINSIIQSDGTLITKAIIFFFYGLLVISGIDNIIKPKIVGDRAKVSAATIIVGVLGGVMLLGVIGIVIGPLILALAATFIKIYEEERYREER